MRMRMRKEREERNRGMKERVASKERTHTPFSSHKNMSPSTGLEKKKKKKRRTMPGPCSSFVAHLHLSRMIMLRSCCRSTDPSGRKWCMAHTMHSHWPHATCPRVYWCHHWMDVVITVTGRRTTRHQTLGTKRRQASKQATPSIGILDDFALTLLLPLHALCMNPRQSSPIKGEQV